MLRIILAGEKGAQRTEVSLGDANLEEALAARGELDVAPKTHARAIRTGIREGFAGKGRGKQDATATRGVMQEVLPQQEDLTHIVSHGNRCGVAVADLDPHTSRLGKPGRYVRQRRKPASAPAGQAWNPQELRDDLQSL